MFSASPALVIAARVISSICCLIGALAAHATNAKCLKKVFNSSSVGISIGFALIASRIAFNFGQTSSTPEMLEIQVMFQLFKTNGIFKC